MQVNNKYEDIDDVAVELLTSAVSDEYAHLVYEKIMDDVRGDVEICSNIAETGRYYDFTNTDVKYAIGRALLFLLDKLYPCKKNNE